MDAVRILEPIHTYSQAKDITGGLSRTSKMPCYSWGLPATACKTGSILRQVSNTTCSKCYAHKGFFSYFAKPAYDKRLEGILHPQWAEAMLFLLNHTIPVGNPYFRWFCSGDLQSMKMLRDIVWIAQQTPIIRHWLPTQEKSLVIRFVKQYGSFPTNLTVRISTVRINGNPPADWPLTSTVVTEQPTCKAPSQNNQCQRCRLCWDQSVSNVRYFLH